MIDNIKQNTKGTMPRLAVITLILPGEFVNESFSHVAIAAMWIGSSVVVLVGLFFFSQLVNDFKGKFSLINISVVFVLDILCAAYAAHKGCDYLLYFQCTKAAAWLAVMNAVNKKLDEKENAQKGDIKNG